MSILNVHAPITKSDIARARAFGIALPRIPLAVEPAPAVEPVADDSTWDNWTDDDAVWELGPDSSTIDLTKFSAPMQADSESAHGALTEAWFSLSPTAAVRLPEVSQPRGSVERDGERASWSYGFAASPEDARDAAMIFAPPRRLPVRIGASDPVRDTDMVRLGGTS